MLGLARRTLKKGTSAASICRGRAQALPFASWTFDAVVVTFPTAFIYEPGTLCELGRVLEAGRRLVIVLEAELTDRDTHARCIDGLCYLAGQRDQRPEIVELLDAAGFRAQCDTVALPGGRVIIAVGTKQPGGPQGGSPADEALLPLRVEGSRHVSHERRSEAVPPTDY
jgi:hypothetical protein